MKPIHKALIGTGVTILFAYLTYKGIRGFIEVIGGTGNLGDGISNLELYVSEGSKEVLANAKTLVQNGYKALTSYPHILPIGTHASEIGDIVQNIDTYNAQELTDTIIPKIQEVKNSYSGVGNCPHKMTIPTILTIFSTSKTTKLWKNYSKNARSTSQV